MEYKSSVVKVSLNNKYRTRNGDKAVILKTNINNPVFTVIGYIINKYGEERVCVWNSNGKASFSNDDKFCHENDLFEVSEWDDFVIDQLVLYKLNKEGEWLKGHFAGLHDLGSGKFPLIWSSGGTSWTVRTSFSVSECRIPTCEETNEYLNSFKDKQHSIFFKK